MIYGREHFPPSIAHILKASYIQTVSPVTHLSTCGGQLLVGRGCRAPDTSHRYKRLPPRSDPAALPSFSPPSTPTGRAPGPLDRTGLVLPWRGAYCRKRKRGQTLDTRKDIQMVSLERAGNKNDLSHRWGSCWLKQEEWTCGFVSIKQ